MHQIRLQKQMRHHHGQKRVAETTKAVMVSLVASLGFSTLTQAQIRPERPDFFERGQEQLELEIDRLQQHQPDSVPILNIDSVSPHWSAVLLREGGGMIWMPQGIVSDDTQTVDSVDGNIDFEVISTTSAIGRFTVAFSEAEATFANTAPDELLDRVRTRIIGNQTGFGAVGDRTITFNTYEGREFTLQNADEIINFRILLVQDRLYVMAVSQPPESDHQGAIATFFNSFQPL